ncbi:Hypothetical_protein [Hexamita inflata]|uniref:Hypothetical_protein n=1 Tax=Hexamita inflata TaxID=28002 RepID=A0AA86NX24_9EUKA|nr:Hypothetical protein HINF_LOCUS13916 [Hexamita inflata]
MSCPVCKSLLIHVEKAIVCPLCGYRENLKNFVIEDRFANGNRHISQYQMQQRKIKVQKARVDAQLTFQERLDYVVDNSKSTLDVLLSSSKISNEQFDVALTLVLKFKQFFDQYFESSYLRNFNQLQQQFDNEFTLISIFGCQPHEQMHIAQYLQLVNLVLSLQGVNLTNAELRAASGSSNKYKSNQSQKFYYLFISTEKLVQTQKFIQMDVFVNRIFSQIDFSDQVQNKLIQFSSKLKPAFYKFSAGFTHSECEQFDLGAAASAILAVSFFLQHFKIIKNEQHTKYKNIERKDIELKESLQKLYDVKEKKKIDQDKYYSILDKIKKRIQEEPECQKHMFELGDKIENVQVISKPSQQADFGIYNEICRICNTNPKSTIIKANELYINKVLK